MELRNLVYLALVITPFSPTRSLKISSSINWTAITGEAANTQRNALGASAIIFSLLVKMAMIG
jgi:hypothetical protein